MFALNEHPLFSDSPRRITSTRLSHDRRLTISAWGRIEVLTNPLYRGSNIRILNGTTRSSWLFYPQFSNTASISDCDGCRPIVLGPVKDLVVLQRLRNCHVSVICRRLIISDSKNLIVFINTPTSPIVTDNCHNVKFAPYNVYYDVSRNYNLAYEYQGLWWMFILFFCNTYLDA